MEFLDYDNKCQMTMNYSFIVNMSIQIVKHLFSWKIENKKIDPFQCLLENNGVDCYS